MQCKLYFRIAIRGRRRAEEKNPRHKIFGTHRVGEKVKKKTPNLINFSEKIKSILRLRARRKMKGSCNNTLNTRAGLGGSL